MKKILLLAGEESGVLYAKGIAERAHRTYPGVQIRGYADYGFETQDLAVMGFGAVLRHLFYFLGVKRTMERVIDEWRPDVICTVDYPGMNLKLAAYAKARGIRAVHVVCPQVWAWKAGRIPKIESALDRLCCFFPFEPRLFKSGFATFIGHPLAAEMREGNAKIADEGKGESESVKRRILAVLPGSRDSEIRRHMPILLKVLCSLRGKYPNLDVVIPAANDRAFARLSTFNLQPSTFNLIHGGARELLRKADCAVVASGTATLEAALVRCPTVLVYRVGRLLAWFARRVIKGVKHVGLANVVWEKCEKDGGSEAPMPELLQEDFTVEGVCAHLERWLDTASERAAARQRLGAAMALLRGEGDPLQRVVDELKDGADGSPPHREFASVKSN